MIVDGETGILVKKNDVEGLQAGIRKLLALSADQKREMEGKIIKKFDEIISEDRIGQLIDLYHDTILNYNPHKNADQLTFESYLFPRKI